MKHDSESADRELDRIRDVIQEDVGRRGLATEPDDNLITACADDFRLACHSLAESPQPSLAVVTGFFIPSAQPPCGETDGPLGALFLARALVPLGFRVHLVTDAFCIKALEAGLAACGLARDVPLITLPDFSESQRMGPAAYCEAFFRQTGTLTHLMALERVGPSHTLESLAVQQSSPAAPSSRAAEETEDFTREVPEDQRDRCHNMRGRDITETMSPAHWLFEAAQRQGIITLGVGDGGNELGMGKIPWNIIRRNIPRGGLIACRVPVDFLTVCGISNWGAYGLAAGVRLLRQAPDPELFDSGREHALLSEMVTKGPLVDPVAGKFAASVDGLEFAQYAEVLTKIQASVEA